MAPGVIRHDEVSAGRLLGHPSHDPSALASRPTLRERERQRLSTHAFFRYAARLNTPPEPSLDESLSECWLGHPV